MSPLDGVPRAALTSQLLRARALPPDSLSSRRNTMSTSEADCPTILIKGPAFQRELYRDGGRRSYIDTDLLVSPADLSRSGSILSSLGFELTLDHRDHPAVAELHAQEWKRGRGSDSVDLHWRLAGIGAPADQDQVPFRPLRRDGEKGVEQQVDTFHRNQSPAVDDPPSPLSLFDPPLPIDDKRGGCDTQDQFYKAWTRQHPGLRIDASDVISDNGA